MVTYKVTITGERSDLRRFILDLRVADENGERSDLITDSSLYYERKRNDTVSIVKNPDIIILNRKIMVDGGMTILFINLPDEQHLIILEDLLGKYDLKCTEREV